MALLAGIGPDLIHAAILSDHFMPSGATSPNEVPDMNHVVIAAATVSRGAA